jgi:hypothetical protein
MRIDPEPLAVLAPIPRNKSALAKRAAKEWAAEHPIARGYIEIPMPDSICGRHFFEIEDGKAFPTGAQDCKPEYFKAQDRRIRAAAQWRKKNLKHPTCPCCRCIR